MSTPANPLSSPSALDATLMGQYANSYCSVDYGDGYFANHVSAVYSNNWNALTEPQKEQLLIMACFQIEQLKFVIDDYTIRPNLQYNPTTQGFSYSFERSDPSTRYNPFQFLQFPRNKDVYANGGVYMPEPVMMAQCEQAAYLQTLDTTTLANALQGVTEDYVAAGNVRVKQSIKPTGTTIAPMALANLRSFLITTSRRLRRS